ncbi:MAG: hypothetical protein ACFB10_22360 [Salibacteraceae bacterium]
MNASFLFTHAEHHQLLGLILPVSLYQKVNSLPLTDEFRHGEFLRAEVLHLVQQARESTAVHPHLLAKLRIGLDSLTRFQQNDPVRIIGHQGFMPPGSLGRIGEGKTSRPGNFAYRVVFSGHNKWRWYTSEELAQAI